MENISNLEFYQNNLISYAKYLISAGVILLVLSLLLKAIFDKVGHQIGKSIQNYAKENLKQEIKQVQKQISVNDQRVKQTNEKIARLEGVIQSIENVLDTLLKEREKAVNLLIYDNLSVEESLNESFQNSESVLKLVREIEKEEK